MMTQRELDILNTLCKTQVPMTANDIVEAAISKGLTQSTVIAVLRKLLEDGIVEICGTVHSGKVLSRTYRPTEKAKPAVVNNFLELYHAVEHIISVEDLITQLKEKAPLA